HVTYLTCGVGSAHTGKALLERRKEAVMTRRTPLIAIPALLGALAAPPASAAVLLAPPAREVAVHHPLYLQLWYRSADGGPRRVTVSVARDGKPAVQRKLVAPTQWPTYRLVPA